MKLGNLALAFGLLTALREIEGFAPSLIKSSLSSSAITATTLDQEAAEIGTISSAATTADDVVRQLQKAGVQEQACLDAAGKIRSVSVSEDTEITYIHWPATKKSPSLPPLILVHGFDSSVLEFRRLGPKLAAMGIDTYAVDVLGWGFSQLNGVPSFSADAKVQALQGFVQTKLGDNADFCVAGASLGGAAAIELAFAQKEKCRGIILMDAQGFTDGVGPMSSLPAPLAKMGVAVLKSVPLRNSANQMSYFDKETFATEEAQIIGRVHCLREGWSDAMVSFMKSGGFTPSKKVPEISSPALILWGRQDTILDGKKFATKFLETLPDAELKWIEECGHVPHLEKPDETAASISEFIVSRFGKSSTGNIKSGPPTYIIGSGFFGSLLFLWAAEFLSKLQ